MRYSDWHYPGARWWKFDFHTHTPASADTYWAKSEADLSPKQWLLNFMAAGIDCVAVTDHNSGAWVDRLKQAYSQMKARSDSGKPPNGFRPLKLFPGVELSVHGGFHLLAIFDPSAKTSDIDALLGSVGYDGTRGNSDGVTLKGAAEVVDAVIHAGAIPIPAHADADSGMLRLGEGNSSYLDANTIRQVLDGRRILAIEWRDMSNAMPACATPEGCELAQVLGSDCHSFQGAKAPGGQYSWVKMADPTLEGLRLALLDGNGVSIWRSDDAQAEPPESPEHFVTRIEIDAARFMGNGSPEVIELTPLCNALIGGRGTGKSTVVHALRLAYRRDADLSALGAESEPASRFRQFREVATEHDDDGGLRGGSEIRVEVMRDGEAYRLRWRQDGHGDAVEQRLPDDTWEPARSAAISAERFPIRLLSQGQIAEMAGTGRKALLDVIDEAAGISELKRVLDEEQQRYRALWVDLRAMKRKLDTREEMERRCEDLDRKIEAYKQSEHAQVLQAHQRALRQSREVKRALEELREMPGRIRALAEDLLLDDWPEDLFDASRDRDAIEWGSDARLAAARARTTVADTAKILFKDTQALERDERLAAWRSRASQAQTDHVALQSTLSEQGIGSPQDFTRLVRDRGQIATDLEQLKRLERDRQRLVSERKAQGGRLLSARRAITVARSRFLKETLESNAFVRMEVAPYAYDLENSLRDLIDVHDERFRDDISSLVRVDDVPAGTPLRKQVEIREDQLRDIRKRLGSVDEEFGGHFTNYLNRKHRKPEFADDIRCWFPEDDLRIRYSRSGDGQDWRDISHGSQGQRSAALLAFLLAFGDEPIVLDQPEDDLDNHLIYDLIVRQITENKQRRQLVIVTHNANVVVNGDAELVHAFDFRRGQCSVVQSGALQDRDVREEVCEIMEGGRKAFERRWARLGRDV